MRILRFIVDDQIIKQDPNCDFSGLVPGSEGYLLAEFSFSPEWNGSVKVAAFYSAMGIEYPPQLLKNGKSCYIPVEALKKKTFKVRVIGKKDDYRLITNKVEVVQRGGKA